MTSAQALALVPPYSTSVGLTAQSLLSNPSLFETYQKLAQITAASQLSYGKATSPEQIAVKQRDIFLVMLKGLEIGMLPMQALDSIDVIAGKPALKPQGMLAQIKSRKLLEWMTIDDDGTTCTVTMKRKDEDEPYVESFSMEDADKMMTTEWENNQKKTVPLSQKANWKAQAKTMRKWRAVAACCRIGFPDVIQGMYTPEELGADVMVSEDGEMVIVDPSPAPTTTPLTSNKIVSANGLGQRGGPLGREERPTAISANRPAPEEPPTSKSEQEGEEPKVSWVDDTTKNEKGYTIVETIVSVIQTQTGDKSLNWLLIKDLVPGDPKNYGAQEFAKLAIEGWKVKQKPAAAKKNESKLGKVEEAQPPTEAAGDAIVEIVRYIQPKDKRAQPYLEFETNKGLYVRAYGRTTSFKKLVGEEYFTSNAFESMVPMERGDEGYSIEPLKIYYTIKGNDYNLLDNAEPVTDDNMLDAFFGEKDASNA